MGLNGIWWALTISKYCKRNHFLCVLSSYHEEDEGIGISRVKVQGQSLGGKNQKNMLVKCRILLQKDWRVLILLGFMPVT